MGIELIEPEDRLVEPEDRLDATDSRRAEAGASVDELESALVGARPPSPGGGRDHVAVLTDGGLDPGLGVLVNSLVRSGFDGTLWIGWRDQGRAFLDGLPATVREMLDIRPVKLMTDRPLAYYKPDFLDEVFELAGPNARSVSYVDCDIVVGCEWAFIRSWVGGGLAVAEDLPGRSVGRAHPLRHAWASVMTAAGVPQKRELDSYFNSGFVGIPRASRPILRTWSRLTQALESVPEFRADRVAHYERGTRSTEFEISVPDSAVAIMRPYLLLDQDALNMAIMSSDVALCPMGADAMGFTATRTPIIPHALGPEKPWSKRYLRRLLASGEGPSFADDMWWRYSDGPIPVAAGARYRARRSSWRAAKALRRIL